MAEATTQTSQNNRPQRGPGGPGAGRGGSHGQGNRGPRRPEVAPEPKEFDERIVHIDRVARVVKGGRRFRFRALVVVGDHKGKVGIGIAKGADVTAAVTKATDVAKKHMLIVALHNDTLPHEAEAKVGGARILIKPAAKGTGLIAGGVVRTILEVTGVRNVLSKSLGSTNKANTAYATLEALRMIVPAEKWITRRNEKNETKKAAPKKAVEKVEA